MDGITDPKDMNLNKLGAIAMTGKPGMLLFMRSQGGDHDLVTEQQQRWKTKFIPCLKNQQYLNLKKASPPVPQENH